MMKDNLPDPRKFLAQHWQKRPLLARNALARFAGALDRTRMLALARRDDVESRLIVRNLAQWHAASGPFTPRDYARLPARNWTILINGLETVLPAARELQDAFRFVPYARHDDVMASYAAPGGGVGPHFDSYDVCLVQGGGQRRWQISAQRDLTLVAGAPLKILRHFDAQREWTVEPGDLLYLPPRYAHDGVALTECVTWSVGFRAPSRRDMIERFLDYLRDQERDDAMYRDPRLKPQAHAAAIHPDMLAQVTRMIGTLRWRKTDIERCLGEYLTEPRATVTFTRPSAMTPAQFAQRLGQVFAEAAPASRMLTSGRHAFINGETVAVDSAARKIIGELADTRRLATGLRIGGPARELLYEWYRAGYLLPGQQD